MAPASSLSNPATLQLLKVVTAPAAFRFWMIEAALPGLTWARVGGVVVVGGEGG